LPDLARRFVRRCDPQASIPYAVPLEQLVNVLFRLVLVIARQIYAEPIAVIGQPAPMLSPKKRLSVVDSEGGESSFAIQQGGGDGIEGDRSGGDNAVIGGKEFVHEPIINGYIAKRKPFGTFVPR
jgi:hypothetical protein